MKRSYLLVLLPLATGIGYAQNIIHAGKAANLELTAVGRQHHQIRTTNKEAQEYFDQGVTLLYGFNHEEAARAFEKAATLDPASPMPLWGIAMAVGPNYNMGVDADRERLAFETIQKAKSLAASAPGAEQDYVNALSSRYSGDANPDYQRLAQSYADEMRRISRKYPDDLDAATFYAESLMNLNPWKLWSVEGKAGENTDEIVRVLEAVLARDPLHAGANHYYIHTVEASPAPERALPSAQRLEAMVPRAGHLVHMPAHIYARVGNFSGAVEANTKAIDADVAYAREAERTGSIYDLMYHSHNEQFLAYAASMEGRYAEANRASCSLEKRLSPHAQMPMVDAFLWTPIWVDLRFAKWDAVFARPEPPTAQKISHMMWRYSRAIAFAAQKQVVKAQAERSLFAKEAAALPSDVRIAEMNLSGAVLAIAYEVLAARLAAVTGSEEGAIRHWQAAAAAQDKLNYDEPPDWYYPVRESLGAALLESVKPKEAEEVFREDLRRNPRNPRSLFGLRQSLAAQHADADAAWVDRQFREAWKNADVELQLSDL
jgi:tetratricopeptide (TPR) repeat protein